MAELAPVGNKGFGGSIENGISLKALTIRAISENPSDPQGFKAMPSGKTRNLDIWLGKPMQIDVTGSEPATTSNYHRLLISRFVQDFEVTVLFGTHDEVVAIIPTISIIRVEWVDQRGEEKPRKTLGNPSTIKPRAGTVEWREQVVRQFPSAYERWSADEDSKLRSEFAQGMSTGAIAKLHSRRPGAIRSRLRKLGLQ